MGRCSPAIGTLASGRPSAATSTAGRAFAMVAVQDGVVVGATTAAAEDRTVVADVVGVEVLGDGATVVDAASNGVPFSVTSRSTPAGPQEVSSLSARTRPSRHKTFGPSHRRTPWAARHVFQNSALSEKVPSLHCANAPGGIGVSADTLGRSSDRPDTAPVSTPSRIDPTSPRKASRMCGAPIIRRNGVYSASSGHWPAGHEIFTRLPRQARVLRPARGIVHNRLNLIVNFL